MSEKIVREKRSRTSPEQRLILEDYISRLVYKLAKGKDVRCKDVFDAFKDSIREDTIEEFSNIKEHTLRSIIVLCPYFDTTRRGYWGLTREGELRASSMVANEELSEIPEIVKNFDNEEDKQIVENEIIKSLYKSSCHVQGLGIRITRVVRDVLSKLDRTKLHAPDVSATEGMVRYLGILSRKVDKPSFGFWGLCEDYYKIAEEMFTDIERDRYWITVELSNIGEQKLAEGELQRILRMHLDSDDVPIFSPSAKFIKKTNQKSEIFHLIQGYIFVGSGLKLRKYLDLEETPYVSRIFYDTLSDGQIQLKLLPNSKIEGMREELSKMMLGAISVGDTVLINSGLYQGIEGQIIAISENDANVELKFRSMVIITKLPRIFLDTIK